MSREPHDEIPSFCAIDFETATPERDSPCALAVVRVEGARIVSEWRSLIRPPQGRIDPRFTGIHGIQSQDVRNAPEFPDAWKTAKSMIRGAAFVAAHNAGFDRSVLNAACERYRLPTPRRRFLCTVQLARETWGMRPTRLPDVCEQLGIELDHHDALSDARACARIVVAAYAGG